MRNGIKALPSSTATGTAVGELTNDTFRLDKESTFNSLVVRLVVRGKMNLPLGWERDSEETRGANKKNTRRLVALGSKQDLEAQ